MKNRQYTYRDLILAYIEANQDSRAFIHEDFERYAKALLSHLETAFGVAISREAANESGQGALFMLFASTVNSYRQITTPASDYLESGLLVRKVEELGGRGEHILSALEKIAELAKANREVHLEARESLFEGMFSPRVTVVTSEQLRANGFDDSTEPQIQD